MNGIKFAIMALSALFLLLAIASIGLGLPADAHAHPMLGITPTPEPTSPPPTPEPTSPPPTPEPKRKSPPPPEPTLLPTPEVLIPLLPETGAEQSPAPFLLLISGVCLTAGGLMMIRARRTCIPQPVAPEEDAPVQ